LLEDLGKDGAVGHAVQLVAFSFICEDDCAKFRTVNSLAISRHYRFFAESFEYFGDKSRVLV